MIKSWRIIIISSIMGQILVWFFSVSIQCLESVYSINRSDPAQVQRLKCDKSLEEIFESAIQVGQVI